MYVLQNISYEVYITKDIRQNIDYKTKQTKIGSALILYIVDLGWFGLVKPDLTPSRIQNLKSWRIADICPTKRLAALSASNMALHVDESALPH